MRLRLACALSAVVCGGALAQAEPPLPSGRFQIGGTGIKCVRAPCPTIGIVKIDAASGKPGWPIFSGEAPPRIEGEASASAEVERHWTAGGCLIVDGAFLQPSVFKVERIVEICGPRRSPRGP